MNMNQVTKKTATQQAMENLITYISGDTVQVGDKIPNEKDLCISLGVGRGTIREAVKVLISQGYLEIKPGLGTYVKSKAPQQGDSLSNWFFANEVAIQDIIIVRATLEPLATAMAIERCTPEQLELLQQNQADAEAAVEQGDYTALGALDEEFHRLIFVISGNALLVEFNSMISKCLSQFRQNTFKIKNNVENFIPAHGAIIRAFETKDTALGEKKMRQHIKKVSKDLETSKYNTI